MSELSSQIPADGFSNSELDTYLYCRRKWWLTYYRRLGLKAVDLTGPRAVGSRFHAAMAAAYPPSGIDPVEPLEALNLLIDEDRSQVPEDKLKRFDSEAELQRRMVAGFLEWIQETGVYQNLRTISAETYLSAPLILPDGQEVELIGKIDRRKERITDGVRLIEDYKTVQSFPDHTRALRQNTQMMHYLWLDQSQPGLETACNGVLYTMIRKVKRTASAKPPFFMQSEVMYSRKEVSSYERHAQGVISDILSTRNKLDQGMNHQIAAPNHPNRDCSWKCDFYLVCPMFDDGSRAEDFLAKHYRDKDPHEHYR